jgi:hypothetical protein
MNSISKWMALDWHANKGKLFTVLLSAVLMIGGSGQTAWADLVVSYVLPQGDVNYAWNSKYGPWGYTQGGASLDVGLSMGGQYGNDYTMGILEIDISRLRGGTLFQSALWVYSNGFGTGYWYGSAGMRWLDTGTRTLTGDPVADQLGPILGTPALEYELWSSDRGQSAGWFSFDVTTHIQADLTAGRNFSTFVLNGSRDTFGGIRAAEYGGGFGARLESLSSVPEPGGAGVLFLASLALVRVRSGHRRAGG